MTLADRVLKELPQNYREACARWSGKPIVGYTGDETLAVEVAWAIVSAFRHDPLLARYVQHLSPRESGGPRNVEPWQAMGERVYAALEVLSIALGDPHVAFHEVFGNWTRSERQAAVAVGLAVKILRSQLYQWSSEMEHFATAAPLPKHTVSRQVLPQPEMFFSFETAWGMTDLEGNDTGSRNWMFVTDDGSGFSAIMDVQVGYGAAAHLTIAGNNFSYGRVYPTDFSGQRRDVAHRMLALLAFINSPYVETQRERLPRTVRREIQRIGHGDEEQTVSVIKLRRRVLAQHEPESFDESGREYHHRWWVAGHHRAQWYGSEQAHRVIWIAPYVKGPSNAPLLEHMYSVVR